ncbi:MBL fold metallo-hydrolase [Leekyejoonella antrihumi]|uniref:MBL fold metallo-hydrolase n=1 Tax=Leekyejoonella antrihumi TaxID=1660198 RepID=A0A563E3A4_9MICO|nr:MBL fold metallo-hydrolase [Leekyejoonella antrihumi]TWP36681.1 MBL fold metallo-hydrolase [Leekyejoonella antrihumi]
MLVASFPAVALGTNCYVLATKAGGECVVVDPGIEVDDQLHQVLTELSLTPTAVLLTHGHVDHVYSAARVGQDVPVYIHADDRYRLTDPMADLPAGMVAAFEQQLGRPTRWSEPATVVGLVDGQRLELAGLSIDVHHAPGHTQGSILLQLADVPEGTDAEVACTVLTGDVLFAGTIGRTDLSGGDHATMLRTLRDVVLALPDDALVLPGHGPATTMVRERATNPFLQTF